MTAATYAPASTAPDHLRLAPLWGGMPLNEYETQLLAGFPLRASVFDHGQELAAPGVAMDRPKYILSGWVALARLLDDGRRQIVDLQVAGELSAFDLRPGAVTKGVYICLTPVRCIDAGDLTERALARPDLFPNVVAGLRRMDDEAHSRLLDQVVRLGRMLAHERVAHFALDLHQRHDRAGLAIARTFPMPLTQEVIGDVLGLSTVHVNRTLQQLRRDGLLKTTTGRWQISDIEQLKDIASGARSRDNGARGHQM